MILLILAAICFILGLVFGFLVIGYVMTGAVFAGLGCLFMVFWLLGRMKNRRAAGIIRRVVIILLIVGVVLVILTEIPIISNAGTDKDAGADYLIVLGAGVNGTVPSLSLVNRLSSALDYLEKFSDAVVIVSGGQGPGEDISEAEAMRIWLEERGIAPERIIIEDESTSTQENVRFSLDIIERRGDADASVAIVSSEYHLYRAKCIAADLGVQAKGVAARTPHISLQINYFLREAFAVWNMWVFQ